MTQKKNGFWRFVFSLLPGAGEMYMGFMKMGVSLMSIFFGTIAIAVFLDIGPLLFVICIVWFYSFFHVHNLAIMPDEEFYALEDDYLFHVMDGERDGLSFIKTYRKVIAVVLIVVGGLMLWRGFFSIIRGWIPDELYWAISDVAYRIPQFVVGFAIIVLGIYMIRGKKIQLGKDETASKQKDKVIDVVAEEVNK